MAKAKLTDRTVKNAAPGRHMDGTVRGLSLLVWPSGARSWVLRYQLNGIRRDMGLGPYPELSLAEARERAEGSETSHGSRGSAIGLPVQPFRAQRDHGGIQT